MPLLDPMCGSGTFLTEAGDDRARHRARREPQFRFRKAQPLRQAKPGRRCANARRRRRKTSTKTTIYGSDRYGDALKLARANLAAIGLEDIVSLKQANVLEMPPPAESGVIVTNPPYGVRLEEPDDLAQFYPQLGDALKQKFSGWTRLHPHRRHARCPS